MHSASHFDNVDQNSWVLRCPHIITIVLSLKQKVVLRLCFTFLCGLFWSILLYFTSLHRLFCSVWCMFWFIRIVWPTPITVFPLLCNFLLPTHYCFSLLYSSSLSYYFSHLYLFPVCNNFATPLMVGFTLSFFTSETQICSSALQYV